MNREREKRERGNNTTGTRDKGVVRREESYVEGRIALAKV